jgi:hypothetical protein
MKNMLPTMTTKANTKTNIQSAIYVVLAQLILSLQSVAVKYIGIDLSYYGNCYFSLYDCHP